MMEMAASSSSLEAYSVAALPVTVPTRLMYPTVVRVANHHCETVAYLISSTEKVPGLRAPGTST